jgi:hypothetical protein
MGWAKAKIKKAINNNLEARIKSSTGFLFDEVSSFTLLSKAILENWIFLTLLKLKR